MKKLNIKILAIAANIFGSLAYAVVPADVKRFKNAFICADCNLSDADLSHAELFGYMVDNVTD